MYFAAGGADGGASALSFVPMSYTKLNQGANPVLQDRRWNALKILALLQISMPSTPILLVVPSQHARIYSCAVCHFSFYADVRGVCARVRRRSTAPTAHLPQSAWTLQTTLSGDCAPSSPICTPLWTYYGPAFDALQINGRRRFSAAGAALLSFVSAVLRQTAGFMPYSRVSGTPLIALTAQHTMTLLLICVDCSGFARHPRQVRTADLLARRHTAAPSIMHVYPSHFTPSVTHRCTTSD